LTAFEALDLIDVDYDILATISDPEEGPRDSRTTHSRIRRRRNIHKLVALEFGNVEGRLWPRPMRFLKTTFFFQGNTHLAIEQHASVAI